MASLNSVRQKIDHAKSHLNLAKSEMTAYLEANPGEFVAHTSSTRDKPTFVLQSKQPIPEKIGLIVGDSLQNLRSSLDYLIWELVLKAGNTPGKENMFPICSTLQGFQGAQRANRLQGVDPSVIALIELFQPYRDGQPSTTCLAILDKLTNINKHRRLLLTELSSFSATEMFDNWDNWVKSGSPDLSTLAHDTGIGKVFTAEQMNMQGDLITFIAFNEGAVTDMEVGCAVDGLIAYLNELVDRFAVFF